jgi:hypothetical protein
MGYRLSPFSYETAHVFLTNFLHCSLLRIGIAFRRRFGPGPARARKKESAGYCRRLGPNYALRRLLLLPEPMLNRTIVSASTPAAANLIFVHVFILSPFSFRASPAEPGSPLRRAAQDNSAGGSKNPLVKI